MGLEANYVILSLFLLNTTDLPPKASELDMEMQTVPDLAAPHCPHRGGIHPSWIQTVASWQGHPFSVGRQE